jgi:hypothetical protein
MSTLDPIIIYSIKTVVGRQQSVCRFRGSDVLLFPNSDVFFNRAFARCYNRLDDDFHGRLAAHLSQMP